LTRALVFYDGKWTICRLGIFGVAGVALAGWVSADEEGALICLCGEEHVTREIEDPTPAEMQRHTEVQQVITDGDGITGVQFLLKKRADK
jgi:hypothetical protein